MTLSGLVIVNYGTGNLNSVKRALDRMGAGAVISSSSADIERADKIILPGVGHFATAMTKLDELGLIEALNEAVLGRKKPVLGICLGMELMAKRSEEGNARGLGWLDAESVRLKFSDRELYKTPHMGWNQIAIMKDSKLMQGVAEGEEFYFAHSYHLRLNDGSDILNETEYEGRFASAIEKENIFGVQYHPEKSHDAGRRLLSNFVEM